MVEVFPAVLVPVTSIGLGVWSLDPRPNIDLIRQRRSKLNPTFNPDASPVNHHQFYPLPESAIVLPFSVASNEKKGLQERK